MLSNMIKNLPNSTIGNKEQYWFDGDKYLSSVIREHIGVFSNNFDLYNTPTLNLLPECRKYAREHFMNTECLEVISEWCSGAVKNVELDKNVVGIFFCEDIEQTFVSHFSKRFKKHVDGRSAEEISSMLVEECIGLNGASFKRLALKKWSA